MDIRSFTMNDKISVFNLHHLLRSSPPGLSLPQKPDLQSGKGVRATRCLWSRTGLGTPRSATR